MPREVCDHAAHAEMDLARATLDIDMVMHVETGAVVFADARAHIEGWGHDLKLPAEKNGSIHRFLRDNGARIDLAQCAGSSRYGSSAG
ncbi:hypothetical protein [Rhodococcus sp. 24CO]|uniref:hypothetical protein n=1 Tax=Rhodococcus sp. 24CO TaxID=3117460 RepID=UPI003D34002C